MKELIVASSFISTTKPFFKYFKEHILMYGSEIKIFYKLFLKEAFYDLWKVGRGLLYLSNRDYI